MFFSCTPVVIKLLGFPWPTDYMPLSQPELCQGVVKFDKKTSKPPASAIHDVSDPCSLDLTALMDEAETNFVREFTLCLVGSLFPASALSNFC